MRHDLVSSLISNKYNSCQLVVNSSINIIEWACYYSIFICMYFFFTNLNDALVETTEAGNEFQPSQKGNIDLAQLRSPLVRFFFCFFFEDNF